MTVNDADRYDRQIRLFGADGQAALADAKVAVLGLGGLGSHVCQQLAYLGVRKYVLVDGDDVTDTSLNRLIGASPGDVGRAKTEIANRLIKSIQPEATVTEIAKGLPHGDIDSALAGGVDLIVGCFDHDRPRLQTTDIASRLGIPYIDAATDTAQSDNGDLVYGGHVKVSGIERGCLSCMDMLDQMQISIASMGQEQRDAHAKMYGVPVESLLTTGPSVVTLNGVVGSLAATEALMILTGLRSPRGLQMYYGHIGRIVSSRDVPTAACAYCRRWGV